MKPGLYEQIINRQMNHELELIPEDCKHQEKVDSAEASRVLATYAAELLKRKMDAIYEASGDEALGAQISYINQVIGSMGVESEEQLLIENTGEQLLNLLQQSGEQKLLGKKAKDTPRPETSMAYSSLFTGASREPQMLTELKKEIASADQIDMLVSFIKWSGLEWNVKAAEKDMADTIEKVKATFESYWNDNEFVTYNESQKERLIQELRNEKYVGEGEERRFVFDIRPYSYQQEILDKLDVERKVFHHNRNLVVAATGDDAIIRTGRKAA